MKLRLVRSFQKYLLNPWLKGFAALGLLPRGWAILETTGRRTGKHRRVPVGSELDGDTFWLVAEHGRRAGYVRNVEADPQVRVRIGRRWRTGTAHALPGDDPLARLERMRNRSNAAAVRRFGTELLTVRIDLDRPDPTK